ncbi:DUF4329 domain-containing protein [Pseudoruegeria sp. SK021]|uniref:DUF4329 domain-containing protein n=1 Tax=Pseudoruegeria sp. SK021 TaxID=1933035 RepID=UPI000A25D4CC|nr:DUF4329 domain-containing protein [Pseudoruegeria sp. SK021]OSP56603.1 hypothetical protein BV911_01190 [Pseudoruegeria sp. SK021]
MSRGARRIGWLIAGLWALLVGGGAQAQTAAEVAAASSYLSRLQAVSFASNHEYCGVLGYRFDGVIVAIRASEGTRFSCTSGYAPKEVRVFASYHTHGAYDVGYDGEVPSVADVLDDMDMGVDGYIATPGGRLWFVDGETGNSRQICGRGCLPVDPHFQPETYGPVLPSYTLATLRRREGG